MSFGGHYQIDALCHPPRAVPYYTLHSLEYGQAHVQSRQGGGTALSGAARHETWRRRAYVVIGIRSAVHCLHMRVGATRTAVEWSDSYRPGDFVTSFGPGARKGRSRHSCADDYSEQELSSCFPSMFTNLERLNRALGHLAVAWSFGRILPCCACPLTRHILMMGDPTVVMMEGRHCNLCSVRDRSAAATMDTEAETGEPTLEHQGCVSGVFMQDGSVLVSILQLRTFAA